MLPVAANRPGFISSSDVWACLWCPMIEGALKLSGTLGWDVKGVGNLKNDQKLQKAQKLHGSCSNLISRRRQSGHFLQFRPACFFLLFQHAYSLDQTVILPIKNLKYENAR